MKCKRKKVNKFHLYLSFFVKVFELYIDYNIVVMPVPMWMNLCQPICIQFSYLIGEMNGDGVFVDFIIRICIGNETNKNV